MNKTIYIKSEDAPVWERARELAGRRLSVVIMKAVKAFVAEAEAKICRSCGYPRPILPRK